MREIKFREWDPIRQEAYGKYGLSYGDREDYDDMIAFRFSHTEYMGEDLIKDRVIEQYTGLKDFNGVEIYEGDILQDVDNENIVGYVEYDDAFGEYDCGDNNLYECTRDCQVVGNIHEQPELLEEK